MSGMSECPEKIIIIKKYFFIIFLNIFNKCLIFRALKWFHITNFMVYFEKDIFFY